jgi:hypothetical protein
VISFEVPIFNPEVHSSTAMLLLPPSLKRKVAEEKNKKEGMRQRVAAKARASHHLSNLKWRIV